MKLVEAMEIINQQTKTSYRVHFERRGGSCWVTDHFPDDNEPPFEHESEAWDLASKFARKCNNAFNVYVVDQHWSPVAGYAERILNKR